MKKIIVLLLSLFCFNSYANDSENIKNFIADFSTKFETINNNNSADKEQQLYNLAKEILNLNWMGNFILGNYRKTIPEDKKADFIEQYSRSLIRNYMSTLAVYKKNSYEILKIEEGKRKGVFNVDTTIKAEDKIINNSFRITKKGDKYYITDIIVEGVSFISSQRSEVSSIISSKGFDAFLQELKEKNGNN